MFTKHSEETKKKLSKIKKQQFANGLNVWNKGKKTGLAPWRGKKRPDISVKLKGHPFYTGGEKGWFKKGIRPWNTGKKCSNLSGKNHPNWQGGLTALAFKIRNSFRYRQWRSDIFNRDDFTCQECDVRGGRLEADHFPKRFSDIVREYVIKTIDDAFNCEELWDINNGRTLCRPCHLKTPTFGKRKITTP